MFFSKVWWAASDLGWVVGHSYIVYAPLLTGCTTLLFEVSDGKKRLFRRTLYNAAGYFYKSGFILSAQVRIYYTFFPLQN